MFSKLHDFCNYCLHNNNVPSVVLVCTYEFQCNCTVYAPFQTLMSARVNLAKMAENAANRSAPSAATVQPASEASTVTQVGHTDLDTALHSSRVVSDEKINVVSRFHLSRKPLYEPTLVVDTLNSELLPWRSCIHKIN